MIYEWCNEHQEDCNMIVTQPRRIATFSIASYIAHERREKVWTQLIPTFSVCFFTPFYFSLENPYDIK